MSEDFTRSIYLMNMNRYKVVDGPFASIDEIPKGVLMLVDEDPDYELRVDRSDYVDLDIKENPWWREDEFQ